MRDLTGRECEALTVARRLFLELSSEWDAGKPAEDAFLAARADAAEGALFDFVNSKAHHGGDRVAEALLDSWLRPSTDLPETVEGWEALSAAETFRLPSSGSVDFDEEPSGDDLV